VASLFDHLVRAGEQRWRQIEAERLRRTGIDNQLEFGRLLNRQIGRLLTFSERVRYKRQAADRPLLDLFGSS
jgi:hypothetical protein